MLKIAAKKLKKQMKNMGKTIHHLGNKYTTNEGYTVEIISKLGNNNFIVKFENGYSVKVITGRLTDGKIRNPYHQSVYGVGYFGEGACVASINSECGRIYSIWVEMIRRGYSMKHKIEFPTHKDVTVCEEWHNFQVFAEWYKANYDYIIMKDWHLDKDILIKGNKLYSPETCCFVPAEINSLFKENKKNRVCQYKGVSKNKNRFQAVITKDKKSLYLGTFKTQLEAFEVYKKAKETYIKELADKWKDKIEPKVYEAMYDYKVEK